LNDNADGFVSAFSIFDLALVFTSEDVNFEQSKSSLPNSCVASAVDGVVAAGVDAFFGANGFVDDPGVVEAVTSVVLTGLIVGDFFPRIYAESLHVGARERGEVHWGPLGRRHGELDVTVGNHDFHTRSNSEIVTVRNTVNLHVRSMPPIMPGVGAGECVDFLREAAVDVVISVAAVFHAVGITSSVDAPANFIGVLIASVETH